MLEKVLREDRGPPLRTMVNVAAKRVAVTTRAAVGRDALIPPGPAAARTPAGGINPSPTSNGGFAATREISNPALLQPL